MNKMILVPVALAAILSGCAGNAQLKANALGANIEYMRAQSQVAAKPLVDIQVPVCADGQCNMMVVVVQNPSAGQAQPLRLPADEWAGVANNALKTAGTLGGIFLGGAASANLVGVTGKVVANALATQPDPIVVTQPAPTVFNQPDPTIVNPVIVEQPAPIVEVVRPEIVQPEIEIIEQDVLR